MLPITLIMLSLCVKVHAQDIGTAIGMNASPVLQEDHQNDKPQLQQQQQEQQLANKRLQVAKQLLLIKQWYNSQINFLTINDGWHSAYATDNDLYVSPCSLNVVGGRVVIMGKTNVSNSTTIERGKCQITAPDTDQKMHILSIYFIQ